MHRRSTVRVYGAPQADAPVPALPVPIVWVLAQLTPHFELLGASRCYFRLRDEFLDLCRTADAEGRVVTMALLPTDLLP